MSRSADGLVKLAWVVCQGRDAHVSEFSHLAPGERPEVRCPECGCAVVLRLGAERAWHAAHQPGAFCTLSGPETALHHNVKMYLAQELRGAAHLDIIEPCLGTMDGERAVACSRQQVRRFVADWDDVAVERRLLTRQPDVLLLKDGRPVAAVEVWVSHRVEPDKRDLYKQWDVGWIEVAASSVRVEDPSRWTPVMPLRTAQSGPADPYMCDACRAHEAGAAERRAAAEAQRQAAEAQRAQLQRDRAEAERLSKQLADELLKERERAQALEKQARAKFAREARTIRMRLSRDGALVRRILVFDRFRDDNVVERDALAIVDVNRGGERLGAFVGVVGSFEVVKKVRATPDGYRMLDKAARAYLADERTNAVIIDAPADWFALLNVLKNEEFYKGWTWEGKDHRWPWSGEQPWQPWRPEWTDGDVDCLDLLRFFFVRYLSGLPVRYWWAPTSNSWFQPAIAREERWVLWPEQRPRAPAESGNVSAR